MPDEGVVTQDVGWTAEATFEVVNSVHDLSSALAKTTARRRGRGSA